LNFFLLFYRYNFNPVSVRICDKIQTAEQLFSYGKISMRIADTRLVYIIILWQTIIL
jgi:hypothetical protein